MAYTAAHWGIYEVSRNGAGQPEIRGFSHDPDPSPIGLAALDASRSDLRVQRPSVRRSWLEHGWGARPDLRGLEEFVEVEWNEALDLAASALRDVIARRGNDAIFGGSYGWSSAGRFHHAQSQVHRFLNALGGYVRHADSYSLGAGRVLMPHLVAPMDQLMAMHTSWDVLAANTKLFVSFGGVPAKNSQISQGMVGIHKVRGGLKAMADAGVRFVNVSPVDTDLDTGSGHEWLPIRPNTDTAMLLAMAHTLYSEGLHDEAFLETHCEGFDRFVPYLTGQADGVAKTPEWAAAITGVPAARIAALARELAAVRSIVTISWSLQRSHHGEQPFWALLTLACMLGQIGLPGGGFGVGYGAANGIGNVTPRFGGPTLPQGTNAVSAFIPVARITDMLEKPGQPFNYNGQALHYPDIELIYWAGGNPFHHHQDLHRLLRAWRKPRAVIVNEQFWTPAARAADIVFPATTTFERDDIGYAASERYMVAMRKVIEPVGQSRDDFDIFADIAERLGRRDVFTEGRTSAQWVRHLYDECLDRAHAQGVALPGFDEFWDKGLIDLAPVDKPHVMLADFRADPVANRLKTPSGRIEVFSQTIDGFGYEDCIGHACWYEPVEWLGSAKARKYPLHMLSDQPFTKLHSQLDHSSYSRGNKVAGREPVTLHPEDAAARGIGEGDVVRVFNERGHCLAGARLSHRIRRGVIKLSTGAWFDPASWAAPDALEKHGNPNVLTLDVGTSQLSQGCSAQSCLVDVERFGAVVPPVTAFDPPVPAQR
ncbi:molybdopterin-dependent oxidoreductase [Variovorax sp.]|uniref:molybdopterin-dependent oxidoreductase n=1 Tax=Variovorax sp. TaxID=1871043 RepID=UPI002D27F313|nr:molybdopterin-dependent oxidoreductase [Variovorax sp.]HYP84450.1 molybdopterin-dependent oxidoreductase [Variovorax sp.]